MVFWTAFKFVVCVDKPVHCHNKLISIQSCGHLLTARSLMIEDSNPCLKDSQSGYGLDSVVANLI